METFEEHYASMMDTIRKRMPGADLAIIDKAVDYAKAKHASQTRKDGSPYIIHPLAVAQIVTEMGLDMDAILGAEHSESLAFFCMESRVSSFFTMVSSQWSWVSMLASSASCFSSGR